MQAFLLIGAPGAGKSTYAKKLAKEHDAVVISGDDIRDEMFGSQYAPSQWEEVWAAIEEAVEANVGLPIILDGTHFRTSYRKEAVALLNSYGYSDIEAYILNPELRVCQERNRNRKRKVPDYVVERMHQELQKSLRSIDKEPFTCLNYIF